MIVKTNGFELTIADEYVECEVHHDNSVWYFLEEYLTDELMELIEEYINKDITLLQFVTSFYDSIEFEDEEGEKKPHEFTLDEWNYILG